MWRIIMTYFEKFAAKPALGRFNLKHSEDLCNTYMTRCYAEPGYHRVTNTSFD